MNESFCGLANKLDLNVFLVRFREYFARFREIDQLTLNGDRQFYAALLEELDKWSELPSPPPPVKVLDTALVHLQKYGTLHLAEIYAFASLIDYFSYLKRALSAKSQIAPKLYAWLEKIIIPQELDGLKEQFENEESLKKGVYHDIDSLNHHLKMNTGEIENVMRKILHSPALAPYLVDHCVHYMNQNECLLLKSGYSHVLKGMVLERSQGGFFYLLPDSIIALKERQARLQESLQLAIYEVCKKLSALLHKHLRFLRFLNMAFDMFDSIYARLSFAREHNLCFITTFTDSRDIVLSEFCHPALENPKPFNVVCKGEILMITGVNAGGKTMLLKSLLTACFLTKHLIPFKINPHKSQIPYFKYIVAIISDPQNSANHISTFAGRMLELSNTLHLPNMLLGIDEIELGTDSDEAASLYKVVLEFLLTRTAKVVLTTHHKHLAALMAHNPKVQLLAALYDMQSQRVLFEFLDGSIGKSYAFETAARYGIPSTLITQAKQSYGEDKQRLNELIERSSQLEMDLCAKRDELQSQIALYERKIQALSEQASAQKTEFQSHKAHLDSLYFEAIQTLKSALKETESKSMHQAFNKAHTIMRGLDSKKSSNLEFDPSYKKDKKCYSKHLQVGDRVKYKKTHGVIASIQGKNYMVDLESGVRLKATRDMLTLSTAPAAHTPSFKLIKTHHRHGGVKLDLHGKRGEEAIEELDEFLSNALVAGYDEVLVYHGIGTGVLSRLVRDFLLAHPKVQHFEDAPANMGGFGAKIVRL